MDEECMSVESGLSDADYEDSWRELWNSEDDVVFSPALSVEEQCYSSDYDISHLDESFAFRAESVSVASSDFHNGAASVFNHLVLGPSFALPYALGHQSVSDFHGRLILSQVLGSFSPSLCWLPWAMMLEALFDFFGPILSALVACPSICFSCQLIWYRRLQWISWAYG
ncbi:unnamed protein product [Calypogeia fissa]